MKKNTTKKTTKKELTDVYVISYADIADDNEGVAVGTMMEAHSTFIKAYNYLMRSIEGLAEAEIKQSEDDAMDEYGTIDPKEVAKRMIVMDTLRIGGGELIVKSEGCTQHYVIDRIALKYVK